MAKKEYNWEIGSTPPLIDEHTKIKHQIYQDYIEEYIKTLNKNPMIPSAKFVVVDAFAGGGLYKDNNNIECEGSPVKIWQAMQSGEDAVNSNRNNKFTLNRILFLLEKNKKNFKYLKNYLSELGHDKWFDDEIILKQGGFIDEYINIINSIRAKFSANTRTIFILDQYGYKDVPFASIRDIFTKLPRSEVILTLSVDDISNYIPKAKKPEPIGLFECIQPALENYKGLNHTFKSIGLDADKMFDIKNDANGNEWRAAIEHYVTQELLLYTQAKQFSPFYLSRKNSHKSMWLIHLANHSEATNVIKTIYHKYGNDSKTIVSHYGGCGLDMLGFNNKNVIPAGGIFQNCDEYNFDKIAKAKTHEMLLEDIPKEMHNKKITFDKFYDEHASNTPANKDMVRKAIIDLMQHKELVVMNRKPRSDIQDKDIISTNPQGRIFSYKK